MPAFFLLPAPCSLLPTPTVLSTDYKPSLNQSVIVRKF
jgi:hypothetical protein